MGQRFIEFAGKYTALVNKVKTFFCSLGLEVMPECRDLVFFCADRQTDRNNTGLNSVRHSKCIIFKHRISAHSILPPSIMYRCHLMLYIILILCTLVWVALKCNI